MKPIRLLVLVASLSLFPLSGALAQEKYIPGTDEELYGTWIDPTATSGPYKWVIAPNGVQLEYWRNYDPPYEEVRYTVEKKWTDDEGNVYYQVTSRYAFQPWTEARVRKTWLILYMIDPSGKTLRSVWSTRAMPSDFKSGIQPKTFQKE